MPPARRGRSGGRTIPVVPARAPAPLPVPVEKGVVEVPRGEADQVGGALHALKPQEGIDQVLVFKVVRLINAFI